jgi:multiple RNA-binding domain-containing protein 1
LQLTKECSETTNRFQEAISILNNKPQSRYPTLLKRILIIKAQNCIMGLKKAPSSASNSEASLPFGGVSKTRLCVKNLPQHMTEPDLRQFLHRQIKTSPITITDCRILKSAAGQSRRIAFVGLLTPEQADTAVQQLHRTYCQTSRLQVEFALLPSKNRTVATEENEAEPVSFGSSSADIPAPTTMENSKKSEFVAATTRTTRPFWSNDDDAHIPPSVVENPIHEAPIDDDDGNEEEVVDNESSENPSSAMDFLRSKQVAVQDLDEVPTTTQADVHSADSDPPKGREPTNEMGLDEEEDANENNVGHSNIDLHRLFLRNLPFSISEAEIRQHFESYGTITECHLAVDDQLRSKGFGFLTFATTESADRAKRECDQQDFHGRLLHILPAQPNRNMSSTVDAGTTPGTYKEQREEQRRVQALTNDKGWMSSFVRGDAVLDTLASRLGIHKGEILNVKDGLKSGDAAVRLAIGETTIIEENRQYFRKHGVDMEALVSLHSTDEGSIERSITSLLVKNLPHTTTLEELKQMFVGNVTILLPPSKTIAVIKYPHRNEAKLAFRKLAYRRFKNVPLYLEWAPLAAQVTIPEEEDAITSSLGPAVDPPEETEWTPGPTATLYVKNLNFATTETQLYDFFQQHESQVRAVRIPTQVAARKRGALDAETPAAQSMGYGFVEFASLSAAQAALKQWQGAILDGHALELRPSSATVTSSHSSAARRGASEAEKKLIVRNVPFQASRTELLQLFGSFGTLKKVRLPKKFDGRHRGFAFVEYLTAKDAGHAMQALSKTHLYGRHLVIEWAAKDEEVEDLEFLRAKAEKDITTTTMAPPKGKRIRFE